MSQIDTANADLGLGRRWSIQINHWLSGPLSGLQYIKICSQTIF